MILNFHLQKKAIRTQVKKEILTGIDKNRLSFFKFSKEEVQQLVFEHAHEFEYEGYMYDIVMTTHTSDSVSYWCWKDDNETALNQQIAALLTSAFTQNKPLQQRTENFLQFYKNLFIQPISTILLEQNSFLEHSFQFSLYRTWKDMFALTPPFSPPKLCM